MKRKKVIVLHGLYMPSWIMQYVVRNIRKEGYEVYSFGYNSLNYDNASEKLERYIRNRFKEDDEVYFIGHSLGGLVIRDYFYKYSPSFKDTCIVTVGTPHSGAKLAQFLNDHNASFMLGRTADILNTGMSNHEGNVDIGCIVGTYNVGLGRFINLKDGDGTVTINDAQLNGAKDKIELNLNHTALVYSRQVVEEAVNFIQFRQFTNPKH